MNGPRMGRIGPIHADLIRADPSGPLNPWSISNPNLASCLTPALLDNDYEYELRVDKPEARGVDSPHLWWLVSALDSKLDRINDSKTIETVTVAPLFSSPLQQEQRYAGSSFTR
jgi:hypothetical protein